MSQPRYVLKAYACLTGGLWLWPDEGSKTLDQIFLNRPNECQYAICATADGVFLCVDLYDVRSDGRPLGTLHLGGHTRHETLDAAMMAATLQI
jgi:hypothetical protein